MNKQALKYLGYKDQTLSEEFYILFDECEKEVKEYAQFKSVYRIFELSDDFTIEELNIRLDYQDAKRVLKGCHHIMIVGYTLGYPLERRIKYTQKIDMHKAVIMDAIASAYLEECADEFEKSLFNSRHTRTFRFAPGYGDVPVELNRLFFKAINMDIRLGVTLHSDIFTPQKTMLCFIGLGGKQEERSCGHCISKDHCVYRKAGTRCWRD